MSDVTGAALTFNVEKGWMDIHAVDKTGVVALGANESFDPGAVLSFKSDGDLQLGLAEAAMPLFTLVASDDLDVVGDAGSLVGPSGGADGPNVTCLVAVGAYEFRTTVYDADDAASFVPNATLTAGAPGTADAGVIKLGVAYDDTICGVCSEGLVTKHSSIGSALYFWPTWLPPATQSSDGVSAG